MAERPQTDVPFGQVPLRATVQGAGKHQVFVAPLPRQTSAQVLAKNLSQFSNILGQFSNVQKQRAQEDALSLTTEELVAQMDEQGKEFGLADKIGYEKQFEETVYSRYFDLKMKPMFAQFSQEIKNQGVERLSDLASFEDYVNSGLDGINEKALETINDRPFMKNVHNILFGQARTNFFAKESASYGARRQAYLKDAAVESFDINFPDVSGLTPQLAADAVKNHIVTYEAAFEKSGIAEPSKRKSLIFSGASNQIKALAMDGDFMSARSVLKSLDSVKVNKHAIFKGASGSLFREELEDFIIKEEKSLTAGNSIADKNAIDALALAIQGDIAKLEPDTNKDQFFLIPLVPTAPSVFNVSGDFFDSNEFNDPEAQHIRKLRAELEEDEASVLSHPQIAGSRTRLELYREKLDNWIEEREADITGKMELLLPDGDAGWQLDTYVRDYAITDAIPPSEYPDAYTNAPMSFTQIQNYKVSGLDLPKVLNADVADKLEQLKRQHTDKFNKAMRRRGRQLITDKDMPQNVREAELSDFATKWSNSTLEAIQRDLKEYLKDRKVSSIQAPPPQSRTALDTKVDELTLPTMSQKEGEEARILARNELLKSGATFPSDKTKEANPDVRLKSNFHWWDTSEGSDYERGDYDTYNELKHHTQNKGLFVGKQHSMSDFFEGRKEILAESDFMPSLLEIMQEGKILEDEGIGYRFTMAEIHEKRVKFIRTLEEAGVTEQQAIKQVAGFGGRSYYVKALVEARWQDMPILKWNTIMAYSSPEASPEAKKKATKTLESIVKINGIPSVKAFVDAQTRIYKENTEPLNTNE